MLGLHALGFHQVVGARTHLQNNAVPLDLSFKQEDQCGDCKTDVGAYQLVVEARTHLRNGTVPSFEISTPSKLMTTSSGCRMLDAGLVGLIFRTSTP